MFIVREAIRGRTIYERYRKPPRELIGRNADTWEFRTVDSNANFHHSVGIEYGVGSEATHGGVICILEVKKDRCSLSHW